MKLFSRGPKTQSAPPAGAAPAPPPVTFDETVGDADAQRLRTQMAGGKWRPVHAFLEQVTDWENRSFYLRLVARQADVMDEWVRDTNGSELALLARGMSRVDLAWKARGSGRAQTVAADSWPQFYARLNEAEADLFRASELLPTDPLPWTMLIPTAMGLQLPKEEVLRRLGEVNARYPGFRRAQMGAVNAVAQKWSGSHALMFDVARRADSTLPPGNAGHVAIAYAHLIRKQYYQGWEKDIEAGKQYFKNPAVGEEIRRAADNSVLSPAFVPSLDSAWARADFALCLGATGTVHEPDRIRAAQLFRAIGNHPPARTLWNESWGEKAAASYAYTQDKCLRAELEATRQPQATYP
jgi:hypothetical protein